MSTEITRHSTNTALTIAEDQTGFTDQQIAALRQIGLGANTQADVEVFFHQAKRSGLDPFRREIYMITRKTKNGPKATIQTGIDGFYKIADRVTRQTGGTWGIPETLWCGPDGQWRDVWLEKTPPAAAKVTVERNGSRFTTVATSAEYNAGSPMWQKMPARMIAKCAEALAIRRAFPDDLSGLYTSEEMAQADSPAPTPRTQAQQSQGGSRLAQAMGQRPQPQQQPVESQPEPWQAQWAELKDALAAARLAPEEDRGDLWLAKLTELTGAEWTHPNQISPEAAAEVLQMLATPTADESTGEIVDEPAA
ncbi:phage recombination protein Bet [Escherichia coli]|uniref:phage recombination protein Bet n=1 Tax=Escherichia coli TaxID=562 RepID=UPI001593EA1C|nr:phage recombination protein Bet [Escherichia coli]